MRIFSRKKEPTAQEREEYVGALVDLFQRLEEVSPEDMAEQTPHWVELLRLDKTVSAQSGIYKERFGQSQQKLAWDEANRRMKIK